MKTFTKKQKLCMLFAALAAFILPFLPPPLRADAFALKDHLFVVSAIFAFLVAVLADGLLTAAKALPPERFYYKVLFDSRTNLYGSLVEGLRRLLICVFVNMIFGIVLIIYTPEKEGLFASIFSGLVLSAVALLIVLLWLAAARIINVFYNYHPEKDV